MEISEKPMAIHGAMAEAMKRISAIPKSHRPAKGVQFAYRGIDDLYNAFHAIFADLGVFVTISEVIDYCVKDVVTKKAEADYSKETINAIRGFKFLLRFNASDGSYVETWSIGEGMDSSDKAAGKATSYAMKSALIHCFLVPTVDLEDPDGENPERICEEKYETPELATLKGRVVGYIQASPSIYKGDWLKYADEVCKANDLDGLRACISEAEAVIKERSPK